MFPTFSILSSLSLSFSNTRFFSSSISRPLRLVEWFRNLRDLSISLRSRTAIHLHRPTARRAAFASNARQGVFFFFFFFFTSPLLAFQFSSLRLFFLLPSLILKHSRFALSHSYGGLTEPNPLRFIPCKVARLLTQSQLALCLLSIFLRLFRLSHSLGNYN